VTSSIRQYVRATACVGMLCVASAAAAQTTGSSRGYRGLFGGSGADPGARHSLSTVFSVLAGYDDNATGAELGQPDVLPTLLQSAFYSGPTATLNYTFNGRRLQLATSGGTSAQYYVKQNKLIPVGHFGAAGLSFQPSQRTTVFVNQSVSYAPSYAYALTPEVGQPFPGEVVGSGAAPLGDESLLVYDTGAYLIRNVNQRSTLRFNGDFRYSDFRSTAAATQDLTAYSIGGRYNRELARYSQLRLGYTYREGQFRYSTLRGTADQSTATTADQRTASTAVHDIDAGVDYARPLSLSRKTTLSFSAGFSMLNSPTSSTAIQDVNLVYNVVGNVNLNHQMGRTWSARVAYNRGVGFSETFVAPVFSNGLTADVTGFISRRTEFSSIFSMAMGDVGVASSSDNNFTTYMTNVRVRSAITVHLAVFGEYSFYSQDLNEALIAPDALPPVLDRHSVRGGLTAWFSLWRK
jgi:hypothetical protein